MTENTDNQKLNPQIREIEIGVRNLRKIKIYPLSFGDQLKTTNLLSDTISAFLSSEANDIALVSFIAGLIERNIRDIIGYVVDEDPDELLNDLSNNQVLEIVRLVFEMNYKDALKNGMSLFEEIKELFLSRRPSPPSVNDTAINSETFMEEVSEEGV